VCSVQTQAPGSPIRNVLIMALCMGSYVITRLSEKIAGSFVLPEDGGIFPPKKPVNVYESTRCRITYDLKFPCTSSWKTQIPHFICLCLIARVLAFLCPRSPFKNNRLFLSSHMLQQWATSQQVWLPCTTSCAMHNQQLINQISGHFDTSRHMKILKRR